MVQLYSMPSVEFKPTSYSSQKSALATRLEASLSLEQSPMLWLKLNHRGRNQKIEWASETRKTRRIALEKVTPLTVWDGVLILRFQSNFAYVFKWRRKPRSILIWTLKFWLMKNTGSTIISSESGHECCTPYCLCIGCSLIIMPIGLEPYLRYA